MGKFIWWGDVEVVDGAGLPLDKHAEVIARRLRLTPEQTRVLVAELRNALVPAKLKVGDACDPVTGRDRARATVERGLERALALLDALVDRVNVPSADPYE